MFVRTKIVLGTKICREKNSKGNSFIGHFRYEETKVQSCGQTDYKTQNEKQSVEVHHNKTCQELSVHGVKNDQVTWH